MNKYINKLKYNTIQQIVKNYKYIYFFRYYDLNSQDKINLKKQIKKLDFNFLILKQKLLFNLFRSFKGQGPLIILYGNTLLNYSDFQKIKKLDFIYLFHKNLIYSNLKVKMIFSNKKNNILPLNYQIKKPLISLLYFLKQI